MRQNESSLQPLEQDDARECPVARGAGALRYPATWLKTIRSWLSTRKLSRVMLLDVFERSVVVLLFCHFALVLLTAPEGTAGILGIILLISESLPVFLILTRRESKSRSDKTVDWLLGLVGATLPLLAMPVAAGALVPAGVCGAIMLMGFYVQISAKLFLGRSFGLIPANRGIKVAGPYRIVRHPMYAGYTILHVGFLLGFPSLWNLVLYSTELAIQMARLLREELLLKQDQTYRDYAARVRYRLIPMIF
jgi:protein-S-isoprenylcysteine O-methyltransferase Ste14